MSNPQFKYPSMSLKEILESAALAEKRMETWPEWKRELSFYSLSPPDTASAQARDVVTAGESSNGADLKGR